MEIQDLTAFVFYTLFLGCPLGSIYLTLKMFDWNQKRKLFSDSWLVYLTWLISSLLVTGLAAFFNVGNSFINFLIVIVVLLIVNSLTIATTLSWIGKVKKIADIFDVENEENAPESKQKILKASISISIVTILTVLTLLSVMIGIDSLIERINPKPKNSFEIYDI